MFLLVAENSSCEGYLIVFSVLWIKYSGRISGFIPRHVLAAIEGASEKTFAKEAELEGKLSCHGH